MVLNLTRLKMRAFFPGRACTKKGVPLFANNSKSITARKIGVIKTSPIDAKKKSKTLLKNRVYMFEDKFIDVLTKQINIYEQSVKQQKTVQKL
jgi:hypothetical protein